MRAPSNRYRLLAISVNRRWLLMGCGDIESEHRCLMQQRPERPGAWWTPQNTERMVAMRPNRAIGQWEQCRNQQTMQVA